MDPNQQPPRQGYFGQQPAGTPGPPPNMGPGAPQHMGPGPPHQNIMGPGSVPAQNMGPGSQINDGRNLMQQGPPMAQQGPPMVGPPGWAQPPPPTSSHVPAPFQRPPTTHQQLQQDEDSPFARSAPFAPHQIPKAPAPSMPQQQHHQAGPPMPPVGGISRQPKPPPPTYGAPIHQVQRRSLPLAQPQATSVPRRSPPSPATANKGPSFGPGRPGAVEVTYDAMAKDRPSQPAMTGAESKKALPLSQHANLDNSPYSSGFTMPSTAPFDASRGTSAPLPNELGHGTSVQGGEEEGAIPSTSQRGDPGSYTYNAGFSAPSSAAFDRSSAGARPLQPDQPPTQAMLSEAKQSRLSANEPTNLSYNTAPKAFGLTPAAYDSPQRTRPAQQQQQQQFAQSPAGRKPPHPASPPQVAQQAMPSNLRQGKSFAAPAQPAQPAPSAPGPPVLSSEATSDPAMRGLRVEDALLYLDDVKREFKDRPRIYNEFLIIMKNFKSHVVDTPGVIIRVSKLFRGYNNLILGFNTFLPDGYKISLADLEHNDAMEAAAEMEERELEERFRRQKAQQQEQLHAEQLQHQQREAEVNQRRAGWGRDSYREQEQMLAFEKHPDDRDVEMRDDPYDNRPPPAAGWQHQQQQQQEHHQQHQHPRQPGPPKQRKPQPSPPPEYERPPLEPSFRAGPPKPRQQQQQQHALKQHQISPQRASGAAPPQQHESPASQGNQQPQQQAPQAVEFDHAISYVTTIKRRFANDPSTYHSFLEILHTYQKEQRGIKEVLEQVAHLFQDHPDLLKEFTFFLPDAVQEQAKERLHRAAAESETRLASQRQAQMDAHFQRNNQGPKLIDMTLRDQPRKQDGPAVQPENYVYNSAVERQFFDAAREALSSYTRDGGQAWAEFMKCLDMYAQEILSRSEMLAFVEPLLGKRNNKLFEEFKRMLVAAGSPSVATLEDSWYSVPLSEIDFSRCRRCTPSYRALPRDYPAPPCSERSDMEAKNLNDIWVSLPVGSEESYTFRHMRRNQYEEILFRCEDERFEIDMTIDSNAATLYRLTPIAEEIAHLAQEELTALDLGSKAPAEGTAGLGGARFQYTFDKAILGVIHRNSIVRIYGDNGQEMLDLLSKNPTVAIPLVVQRLRQKDEEWRTVRDRLNKNWKELAEHNYYKSLDHRSLTWRTTDKRATSTRTLIAEIKDRALNSGLEGKEALRIKMDKAKEEHGTFYEVTMGQLLWQNLDLTLLPKPDHRLFTPHLAIMFTDNSWVQRDAYRILAFALERGPISPPDKASCHKLWAEFLGSWFGLTMTWMQKPAVAYQEAKALASAHDLVVPVIPPTIVSEDDEDESMEDEEQVEGRVVTEEVRAGMNVKPAKYSDHHPLPAGAHVSTFYGEGKILEFRKADDVYAVELSFGAVGYLRPATVLCTIMPVEKSAYTRELRSKDQSKLARPGDQLVIGTQGLYLFFRLHQILCRRLVIAKRLAFKVGSDSSLQTMVEQMKDSNPNSTGRRRYEAYLALVYGLVDGGAGGGAEGGKYEDRVRSLLGHGAFELATMDKLISNIWKNLQSMAQDEIMWNLVQLYRRHAAAGSFQPEAMRQEAAYLSEGEAMYAFEYCPMSGVDEAVLYTEYLGVMDDDEEGDGNMDEVDVVVDSAADPPSKRQRR